MFLEWGPDPALLAQVGSPCPTRRRLAHTFDANQVRDPGEHASDLRPVGQGVGLAEAPQSEGPQGRPVLRLGADARADLGHPEIRRHRYATSVGTRVPRWVS